MSGRSGALGGRVRLGRSARRAAGWRALGQAGAARARALTIGGGTTDIQLNIIAERMLAAAGPRPPGVTPPHGAALAALIRPRPDGFACGGTECRARRCYGAPNNLGVTLTS